MKKIFALLLVFVMVFALCACGEAKPAETPVEETKPEEAAPADDGQTVVEEAPAVDPAAKSEGVMTYAEYAAAPMDSPVVIETYVQGHQNWWQDQVTVYTQDPDGGYFLYKMACSEEDAAKLVPGTKIRVTGFKGEFSGEVEVVDATFEFVDGDPWIAQPVDATAAWGSVDLIGYQNQLVTFKGATVEAYDESGAAFVYKDPDGKTDDLYFKVTIGDTTYEFCVEFYLTGADTDVYKAVENLKVGDVIDLEGFLYWYEGPNLHTTAVTVK